MAEPKVTTAPDDEFVTVSEEQAEPETKVVFEVIGDQFTADDYLGMREVPTDTGSFKQARFILDDGIYFINANHSLREGLRTVRPHCGRIRITWVSEQDTGQESKMRVYRVEVARKAPMSRSAIHRAST